VGLRATVRSNEFVVSVETDRPLSTGKESPLQHRDAFAPVNGCAPTASLAQAFPWALDRSSSRAHQALITGASSGIGRALALEFGRGGGHLALCARRAEELEGACADVRAQGGSAVGIPLDVCDTEAVADAARRADRDLGGLEMVIANAGRNRHRHAAQLVWEDVAHVFDVNVRGAVATLVAAIPIFLGRQRGHLVGISSQAGRRGLPRSAAYSASKAALTIFLESLRIDLGPSGLRVTDVQPGFVDTAMTANATHSLPFQWPVERAGRHIVRRLVRAPAVIAFPAPIVLAMGLARRLPAPIFDRVIRAVYGARH
jgi:NAD(P)-dependent dehydrogenase (short-subunit alcohol dehydrogenase family)